ncbi:hypothetical protein AGMMS4956_11650 [Bacteroidia bacterium]|nr:hypothetical protein AGMMS4956_11650 [Bacteroidia bacterium]
MMNFRLSNFLWGILIGVLLPLLCFYLLYRFNYAHLPFTRYVQMLALRSMISKVLTITTIPNLLALYICMWFNKDDCMRGVLGGTMLMAIVMTVLYFVY